MRIAATILLLSATAHADALTLGADQVALDPVHAAFSDDTSPYARAAGYAQLIAGNTTGPGLSAGGAVAVSGFNCDSVTASAHAHLQPMNDQAAEASVDWHICVLRAVLTLEFGGHQRVGVAPAIDARTSLWRRRYDESYNDITIAFGELGFDDGGRNRHMAGIVTAGHGSTVQQDGDDTRTIVPLDVSIVGYRYRRLSDYPLTIDALVLDFNGLKAGNSDLGAVTTSFQLAHASIDLGSVFASAHFGWGLSGGTLSQSGSTEVNGETTSSWSETIDSGGLPELTRTVGELTVGGRTGSFEYSGTAARSLFPTFDGDLGLDTRVSGRIAYARNKTTLMFSPFGARSQTWAREMPTQKSTSYGATLALSQTLTSVLRFDAIGEVAKSPYARLDGDREPTNVLGGQVLVALSAHVKR